MIGWEQLTPLWELLRLMVTNQKYLQVDETPIKVLAIRTIKIKSIKVTCGFNMRR
ncbi:hypothetical protein [Cyclobacterium lianum]|nr:hypothetical protein [Cyclobacterium lianum]